jgi:hypothetical protein
MTIRISPNMVPVELYSYEKAHARNYVCLDSESNNLLYKEVSRIIEKHFGKDKFDNKITLKFQDRDNKSSVLYLTWWDGRVYMGTGVHFFESHK